MNIISNLEVLAIKTYRVVSHPIYSSLGKYSPFECRFNPSCSHYTEQAIRKYGAVRGTLKGITRILRCRPGFGKKEDPLI